MKVVQEHREGLVHPPKFVEASEKLEEEGFRIELWVTKKGLMMLRWVKNDAKWHTSTRDTSNTKATLNQIGNSALQWLQARQCGSGKEDNYAVSER